MSVECLGLGVFRGRSWNNHALKFALFLFLVFILEDKYGLSVSSLIRLISCIGYVDKFCDFLGLTRFYKPGV